MMKTKFLILVFICLFTIFLCGSQAAKEPTIEEFDEEEFVGFENVQKVKEEAELIKRINTEQKDQIPLPPPRTNFYLEYFYGGLVIVYLINFMIGKSSNEKIAKQWLQDVSEIMDENFTKVGVRRANQTSVVDNKLIKETYWNYKLMSTGRNNCVGMQASLQLRRRHDLVTSLIEVIFGSYDTLVIDVLLDKTTDNFVFAAVKKKEEKKYRKNSSDLSAFTKGAQSVDELDSSIVVISEVDELVPRFMNSAVIGALNKLSDEFVKIHCSDQSLISKEHAHSIQFEWKLPRDAEKRQAIMKLVFFLIDRVATIDISKAGKQITEKNRSKIQEALMKETIAQRQEAIQQKKIEKIQKEKEKVSTLTPDEQRRYEEKQAKKDAKKRQPKMKVLFG